jgi:aminoglycoside phosphotransferase family enzyme/predicted kinase
MQASDTAALNRDMVNALARLLHAQLIETHISWVLLAGDTAWKIKKPIKLPFVDYGTLELRRRFCEEELRLNSRLAPTLYLGLTIITGTSSAPVLDGSGAVLEYAVRMRRFPPGALFSEKVIAGNLVGNDVEQLASLVAEFQQRSPTAVGAHGFALAKDHRRLALAALEGASPCASPEEHGLLQNWLEAAAIALVPLWETRRESGAVREGHGDLHLDNIVSLDSGVAAFDCIEFDPALRWIDVLDDITFPVMDFFARGRSDFAFQLLNQWLDLTGDHSALPALSFSVAYRALVRSQVEHLRRPDDTHTARRYLETALYWMRPRHPKLWITYGLPGSGKTFASQGLLQQEGAIRLRSDVERKRLAGLGMLADSRQLGLDLYDADTSASTYKTLLSLARAVLQAGFPVILDAAFLTHKERSCALALAYELDVPFSIVHCEAPTAVMRDRLLARRSDASEADPAVLERLQAVAEPLSDEEIAFVVAAPPGH